MLHELTIENRDELYSNKVIRVCHYINNFKRSFDEGEVIEIVNDKDGDGVLERLFKYAMMVSYDARKEEEGGWTQEARTDGSHDARKKGEVFGDVVVGKLGEIALYRYLSQFDNTIEEPNLIKPGGYGNSDSFDMVWKNQYISIKTTQKKSNLLLLQKSQYDEQGRYLSNVKKKRKPEIFDYHILCKFDSNPKDVFAEIHLNTDTASEVERAYLRKKIVETEWSVSIVGFMTKDVFLNEIIARKQLVLGTDEINKLYRCFGEAKYNKRNKVDVDNYYVQSRDLIPIKKLIRMEGVISYLADKYAYIRDGVEEYCVSEKILQGIQGRGISLKTGMRVSFTVYQSNSGKKYANDIAIEG